MKLQAHPPERRRRGVTLAAHGCCCCCCCCLHTLGGLIGAAVAGTKARTPEGNRTVMAYWLILIATAALGGVGLGLKEGLGASLLMLLVAFPLAQLNASMFCLLASFVWALDLRLLGQITWKAFFWGVIGFVAMLVPFLLSNWR